MNTKTKLVAFHGDQKIKDKYIARVKAHAEADEIIAGKYWENGRGCAVGCTIHSSSHSAYEDEIGIPRVLARLEDRLFEAIYNFAPDRAKEWPLRFITAAHAGSDLSMVWPKFAHWMLVDPETGVIRHAKTERTKESVNKVAALYAQWIKSGVRPDFYAAAAAAADADADAAADDDDDAAAADDDDDAADAAAADAAAAAADADAAAAADAAADAADFYRRCSYWPAWRYYRGYAMDTEKGQARYIGMADKLIQLMHNAPIK